jgi:hypothetical protein
MGLREGARQEYDETMTEHEIVEVVCADGAVTVSCPRCGRRSFVGRKDDPSRDFSAWNLLVAWSEFLHRVPWDCDEALVAEVMSR